MTMLGGLKGNIRVIQKYSQNAAKVVARALGLSLILHAFKSLRHITGRGLHEPLKVAIRQKRSVALARSLIHIVPFGFALFEIVLNWNEYYVGVDTYNQALYQLIAKVHEIMIQASLGVILFSFVRHELAIGRGLPFGALFSGLQLNQISYLWSMEFWGSVRSEHLDLWRKVRLSMAVALCVILGTLCGPSSAILLIPRLGFWPAGNTHIWLNATREQLWPARVDASITPDTCDVALEQHISNECPWSEWTTILEYLTVSKGSMPEPYRDLYGTIDTPGYVELSGKSAIRQFYIREEDTFIPQHVYPALSTTQQAAAADALSSASSLWLLALTNVTAQRGHGNPLSDQSDSTHRIKSNYYQPYVSSVCTPDTLEDENDVRPLVFPILLGANSESQSDTNIEFDGWQGPELVPGITKPGSQRSSIYDASKPPSMYHLRWVELDEGRFRVLMCNLAAGWGTSAISVQRSTSALSGSVGSTVNWVIPEDTNVSIQDIGSPIKQFDPSVTFSYPQFPEIPINISESWANLLSPRFSGSNDTILNRLMQVQTWPGDPNDDGRFVINAMVTNGLARIGFSSELQGQVRTTLGDDGSVQLDGNSWLAGKGDSFIVNASQASNWTKLYLESTLEGHAYNTIGTPPRIAIAVLTTYCIVVLCHVLYAGISGISSTSWDSIAEVTALAMNSTPTEHLRNTCAGITELHIFKLPVRILARKDTEGEGEHLELVFGPVSEKESNKNVIQTNRAYGSMAAVKDKQC